MGGCDFGQGSVMSLDLILVQLEVFIGSIYLCVLILPEEYLQLYPSIRVCRKKKRDDDDAEAVPPRVLEDLADGEGTGLVEEAVVIEDNRENGAVNDNDPAQSPDSLCSNLSEL